MGIMDAFKEEDRIQITVSQLYDIVQEAGRADLFRNGVKNRVPYDYILQVLDGDAEALAKPQGPIWHDAKTDPPKAPGLYYGKKDDSNSMWLCKYRDGKWMMSGGFRDTEMDIVQWAEYTAFEQEG